MGKKPPIYTFQRPKKRSNPSPIVDLYTPVESDFQDDLGSDIDKNINYTKYTFFTVLLMICLSIVAMIYIYLKGLPVKVRP